MEHKLNRWLAQCLYKLTILSWNIHPPNAIEPASRIKGAIGKFPDYVTITEVHYLSVLVIAQPFVNLLKLTISHLQVYQSFLEFIINPDKSFMHGLYFNVSTVIKCEVSLFIFSYLSSVKFYGSGEISIADQFTPCLFITLISFWEAFMRKVVPKWSCFALRSSN